MKRLPEPETVAVEGEHGGLDRREGDMSQSGAYSAFTCFVGLRSWDFSPRCGVDQSTTSLPWPAPCRIAAPAVRVKNKMKLPRL